MYTLWNIAGSAHAVKWNFEYNGETHSAGFYRQCLLHMILCTLYVLRSSINLISQVDDILGENIQHS